MLTDRFRQTTDDRIRRVYDLDCWLAISETLTNIEVVAADGLVVDDVAILPPDARAYQYFISGGEEGSIYDVDFVANTSDGQKRKDRFQIIVGAA